MNEEKYVIIYGQAENSTRWYASCKEVFGMTLFCDTKKEVVEGAIDILGVYLGREFTQKDIGTTVSFKKGTERIKEEVVSPVGLEG